MTDGRMFEPYIIPHGITGLSFFVANEQGEDWYAPLKQYTLLEYEWVRDNVKMPGVVIDAGCHHGNYAVVFDHWVYCVDAHSSNCDITKVNLALNRRNGTVINCAVADHDGEVLFNGQPNGRIGSGRPVESRKLHTICKRANVVKLDVEGAEFGILPGAIDEMEKVHTWIVEVHPTDGDPHALTMEFINRGWEVLKVDRDIMAVVPYAQSTG